MNLSINQFKKKLMEIHEISTLPQVMARIIEIVTDENSCATDLAAEITKDKSLTAKILKIVNSAYYGFYREIVKVSDAVVVLGFNEIKRLSLAMSVLDMFRKDKRTQHRISLWNHSLACAAMSDIIERERGLRNRGAFTAGLLHDIGKAVLDQYFPPMFAAVQVLVHEQSLQFYEAERQLFGFDHSDIGCWLTEKWNLPQNLIEAIRCHHRPETAQTEPELARIVYLANRLSNEFVRMKNSGLTVQNVALEGDPDFAPEKKVQLLLELEQRVAGSTAADLIGY
ncbi:MAG: HDOD domain-containing protein [Candidatus Abyssobacteria bacterium SURF_5]|uniref:HDOD domain-containing protein n=1 Tax=Abyssobacteria bacterium (strain SURF_5) TaxID=2093360 RepID=A0A3A4NIY4_ABYX5|nr:MAG: HDOD domain-containing protein [Candidatus Abyssubacteria bacterium SURF_5]